MRQVYNTCEALEREGSSTKLPLSSSLHLHFTTVGVNLESTFDCSGFRGTLEQEMSRTVQFRCIGREITVANCCRLEAMLDLANSTNHHLDLFLELKTAMDCLNFLSTLSLRLSAFVGCPKTFYIVP